MRAFNNSNWHKKNLQEPRIGDPDCPELAAQYGARGISCYVVFVSEKGQGLYGCIREHCAPYTTRSLEDALCHQRFYHFDHRPFECVHSGW
jgi:hypothetical protein